MDTSFDLFISCLPGIEPFLAAELAALGVEDAEQQGGGVACTADRYLVHRANLELGCAGHVLVRIADFHCRSLGELVRKCARLPWRSLLAAKTPVHITARARKSRLYHTAAIEERVLEGMAAALGTAPPPAPADDPRAAVVHVRFFRDHCTLSLDTSGIPLHRRGYKTMVGKAPLREDLARALLLACGYDGATALLDPFCGCGTIPIEAALIARRLAPGRARSFALECTALFDPGLWSALCLEAEERARPEGSLAAPIAASDRDPEAVAAAAANAAVAGVANDLRLATAPLADAPFLGSGESAPEQGLLASNPPYGVRMGGRRLVHLYQNLGHRFRGLGSGWGLGLMAHDRRLCRRVGVPLDTAFLVDHGGLKVAGMVGRSG